MQQQEAASSKKKNKKIKSKIDAWKSVSPRGPLGQISSFSNCSRSKSCKETSMRTEVNMRNGFNICSEFLSWVLGLRFGGKLV